MMKRRIPFLLLSGVTLATAALSVSAARPQTGSGETDGYRLVWQDLFDADVINPFRWNIEISGSGNGNAELQYYTDSENNVRLGDDGEGNHCLILTARREKYGAHDFTSGRVNSSNFVAFTHGKIEASIKLPRTADGLWPAFWMMGNDYTSVGWPACGETDILEMGHSDGILNRTQDRYFNGACHWGAAWPNKSYAQASTKSYSLQDDDFHLYTLIWDENEYRMYVDLDRYPLQTPYFRINIARPAAADADSPGSYFHKDNFIIFNLAVGGNFPGIHNAAGITALSDENGQEASMYVDFVKIYQKADDPQATLFTAVDSDPIDDDTTGVGATMATLPQLSIEGDTLVSAAGSRLTLYNAEGRMVGGSSGNRMELDTLPKGFYVAMAGGATLKFIR